MSLVWMVDDLFSFPNSINVCALNILYYTVRLYGHMGRGGAPLIIIIMRQGRDRQRSSGQEKVMEVSNTFLHKSRFEREISPVHYQFKRRL